jgi:hypothetical protein
MCRSGVYKAAPKRTIEPRRKTATSYIGFDILTNVAPT